MQSIYKRGHVLNLLFIVILRITTIIAIDEQDRNQIFLFTKLDNKPWENGKNKKIDLKNVILSEKTAKMTTIDTKQEIHDFNASSEFTSLIKLLIAKSTKYKNKSWNKYKIKILIKTLISERFSK